MITLGIIVWASGCALSVRVAFFDLTRESERPLLWAYGALFLIACGCLLLALG